STPPAPQAGTPHAGTPGSGGPATPWYAEPLAGYRGAAGGPFGGGIPTRRSRRYGSRRYGSRNYGYGNYGYGNDGFRNYGFRYRRRWSRRVGPPSPRTNVAWLIVSAALLGLLLPVPAVINWVRAIRYRSPSIVRPPALVWFIWAVVFTVLSVGVFTAYAIAGSTSTQGGGDNGPQVAYVPPKTTTVDLGATVDLVADVGPPKGVSPAPVSINLGSPVHLAHSGVADVNLTAPLRVCATSAKVDPLSVAVSIDMVTSGGRYVFPSFDWHLPDVFYGPAPLKPHQCASGKLGYKLPAGSTIRSFGFEGNAGRNVVWTAP
ncbi:MAG: hypothetical protein J2P58_11895, partial [Acidimicrobiaceae bacterium]|nr:hypothetical protein [Acidimicrobiaceae bacterium]